MSLNSRERLKYQSLCGLKTWKRIWLSYGWMSGLPTHSSPRLHTDLWSLTEERAQTEWVDILTLTTKGKALQTSLGGERRGVHAALLLGGSWGLAGPRSPLEQEKSRVEESKQEGKSEPHIPCPFSWNHRSKMTPPSLIRSLWKQKPNQQALAALSSLPQSTGKTFCLWWKTITKYLRQPNCTYSVSGLFHTREH